MAITRGLYKDIILMITHHRWSFTKHTPNPKPPFPNRAFVGQRDICQPVTSCRVTVPESQKHNPELDVTIGIREPELGPEGVKGENERKGRVARTRQPGTMGMHVCTVSCVLTSMAPRYSKKFKSKIVMGDGRAPQCGNRTVELRRGGMNLYFDKLGE